MQVAADLDQLVGQGVDDRTDVGEREGGDDSSG